MPSEENPQTGVSGTALARQNVGLFSESKIREAIRGATGLSGVGLDRIAEGLARLGVALILPNGGDRQAKFANAVALVRDHGFSINKAAREVGMSPTHLHR